MTDGQAWDRRVWLVGGDPQERPTARRVWDDQVSGQVRGVACRAGRRAEAASSAEQSTADVVGANGVGLGWEEQTCSCRANVTASSQGARADR